MKERYLSFDAERCVGCRTCQLVCSGTWMKVFNPMKARLRIESTEWYGQFEAHICRQHEHAPCVEVCPAGALTYNSKKRVVMFDPELCDGCGQCVDACPERAIFTHHDEERVFKFDLCGGGRVQQCVQACPRDALCVKEVGE